MDNPRRSVASYGTPEQVLRGLTQLRCVRYVPRDRYLSEAELDLILAELPPHRQLWVLLAVYTGGRASELAAIRWEHVDLENCRLLLPGTKTQKSRRWVPIAASLLALLKDIPPELRVGPIAEKWENVRRSLKLAVDRINARRKAEAEKTGAKPERGAT